MKRKFTIEKKITNVENDSFKKYLREVSNIDRITPEEEIELTKKSCLGDKKSIEKLINSNLRFVISVAKKYESAENKLEDLINEGNIGLIMAAHKFTPSKGVKFISYAVWYIRKLILEYITKNGRTIRIPSNKFNSIHKLKQMMSELEQENQYPVDMVEIKNKFSDKMTNDEFMFLDFLSSYRMDSLDREINNDESGGFTLCEMLSDTNSLETDYLVSKPNISNSINKILDGLSERDKTIIVESYGLKGNPPKGLTELGHQMGISRESIRRIKDKYILNFKRNPKMIEVFNNM